METSEVLRQLRLNSLRNSTVKEEVKLAMVDLESFLLTGHPILLGDAHSHIYKVQEALDDPVV